MDDSVEEGRARQKPSGWLMATAVVAFLLAALGITYHWASGRSLETWANPPGAGMFLVSVRIQDAAWQVLEDAEALIVRVLPADQPAGGSTEAHYQKWRQGGWRRIVRQQPPKFDAQSTLKACGDALNMLPREVAWELCVIDSEGRQFRRNSR